MSCDIASCIAEVKKGGVRVYVYVPSLRGSIRVAKGNALELLRNEKKRRQVGGAASLNFAIRAQEQSVVIDPRPVY